MNLPVWQGDNIPDLLEKIRQYVEIQSQAELDWYIASKRHKAGWSRRIRVSAIAFTALGGAVPLLVALGLKKLGWADVSQLGYLFLGTAAALVGFDRFFGFSTSWMRSVTTMIGLEKSREQFRLDWLSLSHRLSRVAPGNSDKYAAATEAMLLRVRDFLLEMKTATEKETQAWVAEFQTNLSQMEKDLRAQLDAGRPGAVDVEVSDAGRATGGMELYLDGLKVEDMTGTTGSIGNVSPGLHKITIKGKTKDRDFTTSRIVTVTASTVAALKLTLGVSEPDSGEAKPSKAAAKDVETSPADQRTAEQGAAKQKGEVKAPPAKTERPAEPAQPASGQEPANKTT